LPFLSGRSVGWDVIHGSYDVTMMIKPWDEIKPLEKFMLVWSVILLALIPFGTIDINDWIFLIFAIDIHFRIIFQTRFHNNLYYNIFGFVIALFTCISGTWFIFN